MDDTLQINIEIAIRSNPYIKPQLSLTLELTYIVILWEVKMTHGKFPSSSIRAHILNR